MTSYVVIVTGARGTGKTTFAQTEFPDATIVRCVGVKSAFKNVNVATLPQKTVLEVQGMPNKLPADLLQRKPRIFRHVGPELGNFQEDGS